MFDLTDPLKGIAAEIDAGRRITPDEALALAEQAPLALLGLLRAAVKERKSGKEVYYNRNFHIEPTNVCVFNCRFCSYRRRPARPRLGITTSGKYSPKSRHTATAARPKCISSGACIRATTFIITPT